MSFSADYQRLDGGAPPYGAKWADDPSSSAAGSDSHIVVDADSYSSETASLVKSGVGGSDADDKFTVGRFSLLICIMICFASSFSTFVPLTQQYAYFRFLRVRTPNATASKQDLSTPCLGNGSSPSEKLVEDEVQVQTSIYIMICTVTLCIPCTVINLLLGSYSDLLGRKKTMFLSVMGATVKGVIFVFIVLFDLNIYLLLVGLLVDAMGGSIFGSFMSCAAYVSDISHGRRRTVLISIVDGCHGLASALAALSVGYAIQSFGFLFPTICLTVLNVAALILLIFLPETVDTKNRPQDHMSPWKHLRNFWEFYRPTAANVKYMLGLGAMFLANIAGTGKLILEPLYQMHPPFCWNSEKIGLYSLIANVAQSMTTLFGVRLLHLCFTDVNIILLGFSSHFASLLVEGFAQQDWQLYIVPVVGILTMTALPCLRATISRMAPQEKLGTVLSGLASIETLTPGLAALLTLVYNATLEVLPSAIFFVMAGCMALSLLFTVQPDGTLEKKARAVQEDGRRRLPPSKKLDDRQT